MFTKNTNTMKFIYSITLLFITSLGFAQDVIYTKDKTKIEAKIIAVGINEIKYQKLNNLTGPEYIVQKSEITLITYANGSFENFEIPANNQVNYDPEYNRNDFLRNGFDSAFNKNILSYHLADLLNYNFTLSYERLLNSGKVGLKFPVRIGVRERYNGSDLSYSGGIDLNFYPTGQGRFKYYVGPAFEIGNARNFNYDFNYIGVNPPRVINDYLFVAGYVNNGAVFQVTEQFSLGTALGIGLRTRDNSYFNQGRIESYGNYPELNARFEFNLGIRF